MTLRLVHPAKPGQATRPRRRGRAVDLNPTERRNLAQALKNLRLRYGTWDCLAAVMGLPEDTITQAAYRRPKHGSAGMALRAARAAGTTVEVILSGKIGPVNTCPTCGSTSTERRAAT